MITGYTAGVFDLFHIGHLNLLKNAKQLCDSLIVGVTTDELSMKVKNKKPVICFEERAEIVKNIKFVDKVVPQITMDKLSAWNNLRFNKMFVGSDWKGSSSWEEYENIFKPLDVQIVYLPHTDGISSTHLKNILERLCSGETILPT